VLDGGRQQSPFWAAFLQRMHALVPRFGPRCLATVINALVRRLNCHHRSGTQNSDSVCNVMPSPFPLYTPPALSSPIIPPSLRFSSPVDQAKLRSSVGPSLVPLDRVLTRRLAEQCRKHFGTEAGFTTQVRADAIHVR
jgi:hypothetical protein